MHRPRVWLLLPLLLATTLSFAQTWTTEIVSDTLPDYGFYHGAAFDANGNLYIAYSAVTSTKRNAPSVVRFITRHSDGTWSAPTTIDTAGATGISVAIDSNGNPAVTESQGALHYLYQDPVTHAWSSETVETSAANDVTSLAFDPNGLATIAYRTCVNKGGGTKFARRTAANTWTKQVVDTSCNARYSSLVYDNLGSPGIAYSDICSGTGTFNCIKYAHYNAGVWTSQVVESGTAGYGTFASLAYDENNNPAVTHYDLGVRCLTSLHGVFTLAFWVNGFSGYGQGAELRFDALNNPVFGFQDYNSVLYTASNAVLATGKPSWIVTNRAYNGVPYLLFYDSGQKKLILLHQ